MKVARARGKEKLRYHQHWQQQQLSGSGSGSGSDYKGICVYMCVPPPAPDRSILITPGFGKNKCRRRISLSGRLRTLWAPPTQVDSLHLLQ